MNRMHHWIKPLRCLAAVLAVALGVLPAVGQSPVNYTKVREMATLSNAAYEQPSQVEGWTLVPELSTKDGDVRAEVRDLSTSG